MRGKSKKRYDRKKLNSIKTLYNESKYSKALSELTEYIDQNPKDQMGYLLYGKILYSNDKLAEAKEIYKKIIDEDTIEKYMAMTELSKIYKIEDRIEEAKDLLIEVINDSPLNTKNAKYTYADILVTEENYTEAKKILETVEEDNELHIKLARIYSLIGKRNLALKEIKQIDMNNLGRNQYFNLVQTYENLNNLKKAREVSNKILNVQKKDYWAYRVNKELIRMDITEGKYNDAINKGYSLLDDKCLDKELYVLLGRAYQGLADYNNALENYKLALKNNKNKGHKCEALFRLGMLQQDVGNFEFAKLCYKGCIEYLYPYKINIYNRLVGLYIKEKNYYEADKLLKKMENIFDIEKDGSYRFFKLTVDKYLYRKPSVKGPYKYREKVIIDYNEEESLKHIIEHREVNIQFNKDIDVRKLFYESQLYLTKENISYGSDADVYIINHDNIAPNCNEYNVVTVPNTKQIITMYPSQGGGYKRVSDYYDVIRNENKKQEEIKKKKYARFYD